MKKKILITGGTGYLGSNIINSLKNKYDFILLKRKSSDLRRISEALDAIEIYDFAEVNEELAQSLNIDILLHCATHYGRKDTDAVNILEANLLLPLRLLSLFKNQLKPLRFINTDTILDKQINAYSLSKCQFKEWMHFFSKDVVFLNLQLEHFYGPDDDKTKFVSFLIDSFLKDVPVLDLTKGEQIRYFTYIDDIVSAFDTIIDKIDEFKDGFTEFQLSNDEPVHVKDFVMLVQKISGNSSTRLNFGSLSYRKGELMDFCINSSPIRELGWKPRVSLEEGITSTIFKDKSNR